MKDIEEELLNLKNHVAGSHYREISSIGLGLVAVAYAIVHLSDTIKLQNPPSSSWKAYDLK